MNMYQGISCVEIARMMDFKIGVSEFELQSRYYVHFLTKWERHKHLFLAEYGRK